MDLWENMVLDKVWSDFNYELIYIIIGGTTHDRIPNPSYTLPQYTFLLSGNKNKNISLYINQPSRFHMLLIGLALDFRKYGLGYIMLSKNCDVGAYSILVYKYIYIYAS